MANENYKNTSGKIWSEVGSGAFILFEEKFVFIKFQEEEKEKRKRQLSFFHFKLEDLQKLLIYTAKHIRKLKENVNNYSFVPYLDAIEGSAERVGFWDIEDSRVLFKSGGFQMRPFFPGRKIRFALLQEPIKVIEENGNEVDEGKLMVERLTIKLNVLKKLVEGLSKEGKVDFQKLLEDNHHKLRSSWFHGQTGTCGEEVEADYDDANIIL